MSVNCQVCNEELKTGKKYCSYECRNKSYEKIISMNCEQCRKEFFGTTRKMKGKNKFCSQNCVDKWKKVAYCGRKIEYVKINCLECGKELERVPSKINEKNFCDRVCKSRFIWASKNLCDLMIFKPCWAKTSNGIIKFRSKWEVVFALDFLDKNNLKWEYEKQKFKLLNGEIYTPDFFIEDNRCFFEIKGYDKSNSTEKFYRFRLENPDVSIIFANKQVLENIYNLNLSNDYLNTIIYKQKEESVT